MTPQNSIIEILVVIYFFFARKKEENINNMLNQNRYPIHLGYTRASMKIEDIQDELKITNSNNKNFIIAIVGRLLGIISFM